MTNIAFKRAVNDAVAMSSDKYDDVSTAPTSRYSRAGVAATATRGPTAIDDDDLDSKDRLQLSGDISAVRMHQLSITLRPLARSSSNGGRTVRLTASRWEIRKAIMSLCCVPPTTMEVEATDKSASIRMSFSVGAAAEDLSRKLRGVTVKIKGIKLHAFVREVSDSSTLSEGGDWASTLFDQSVSEGEREAAFDRLVPGRRPDTIVLRGVPANWLGERGRAAEGTCAPSLEMIMSTFGTVRAVEVAPSAPDASSAVAPVPAAGPTNGSADFDVNALLENMPQPRALAKGKGGGQGGGRSGAGARNAGSGLGSGGSGSGGSVAGGMAVGLNVDAWVQLEEFRGFERALKGLRGRVMQHRSAELLCEYQVGVDVTGYMMDEKRREREIARIEEAKEEARRKNSIDNARGQLVGLREGLQGLRAVLDEDGRLALEDASKPTMAKVAGHVEKAEALLGVYEVDEPAATAAVSHARGEIAIARLSIRKAAEGVNRAEAEERKRREREKDEELRGVAREVLLELEDTLSRGLALVAAEQREHSGIRPQADSAIELLHELSEACSREGGSKALRGDQLVSDARKAVETAATRARILQRFLGVSARLVELRTKADEALRNGDPNTTGVGIGIDIGIGIGHDDIDKSMGNANASKPSLLSYGDEGAGASAGCSESGNCPDETYGSHGRCVLVSQLSLVDDLLGRELEKVSEDNMVVLVESAEEALDAGGRMLDTLRLVSSTSRRLADARAAMAAGDPLLKSSEGVIRLVAAAVISMGKAQREGITKDASAADPSRLLEAGARWERAAKAADSDVAAAEEEVERLAGEIVERRQNEDKERAQREAEEERRLREEHNQRTERATRALGKEIDERRQMEARIFAMELRRKEMAAQVRNKRARERLYSWFKTRRPSIKDSRAIPDRWKMKEGPEVKLSDAGLVGNTAASAGAPAVPATHNEGTAAGALPTLTDRWNLDDGISDLAQRGLKIVGAGFYTTTAATAATAEAAAATNGNESVGRRKRSRHIWTHEEEVEWLDVVAKRIRSTIVGEVPAGNWAMEVDDDGDDAMALGGTEGMDEAEGNASEGDERACFSIRDVASRRHAGAAPVTFKVEEERPDTDTPSLDVENSSRGEEATEGASGAGKTEAELRKRLLAAMGRSKRSGTADCS